jgi:ABC-type proline/glycine betaine transport system permease subunit
MDTNDSQDRLLVLLASLVGIATGVGVALLIISRQRRAEQPALTVADVPPAVPSLFAPVAVLPPPNAPPAPAVAPRVAAAKAPSVTPSIRPQARRLFVVFALLILGAVFAWLGWRSVSGGSTFNGLFFCILAGIQWVAALETAGVFAAARRRFAQQG